MKLFNLDVKLTCGKNKITIKIKSALENGKRNENYISHDYQEN